MVLEALINPKKITGKPWEMYFIGIVYSLVAFVLGNWVFKSYVSLIMVVFTAIAAIPFIHAAIQLEEEKGKETQRFFSIKKHGRMISAFTFLFLGFVTAFLLLFIFLPESTVNDVFKAQISTITEINGRSPTGNYISSENPFTLIFTNNIKVLIFCIIFSIFYGAGAIFILSWNASVMATAIGGTLRGGISATFSALAYFVHGIPEIVAYFIAGLAGGIISVAIMQEDLMSESFCRATKDSLYLIGTALLILLLAAILEVFISPLMM